MLVGYTRVSSHSDHQTPALQRGALLAAGVDDRHLYEDKASGARSDRPGPAWPAPSRSPGPVIALWCGSWIGWAGPCRTC